MRTDKIIEKIKSYLKSKNISCNNNVIEYIGRRKDYEITKGEKKNYYYFSFDSITDMSDQYSTNTYFVYVEEETNKLTLLIGPQFYEKIEE